MVKSNANHVKDDGGKDAEGPTVKENGGEVIIMKEQLGYIRREIQSESGRYR